jgi:uncharacterized protein YbjT (DUF2867 family)
MKQGQILVLGATGMLGRPVVRCLLKKGHRVRAVVRSIESARRICGNAVELIEGSALSRDRLSEGMADCDAVHINLPQEVELTAMRHVVDLASRHPVQRITYVSATTAREENRWFELIDVKLRTEEVLHRSGIPHVVFCPTWVMETLNNFIHGTRAVQIVGRNPPELHFFASADFGRMVGASYDDDRALGRRLFIHGPEGVTLPDALERFVGVCYPGSKMVRMKLWQARLVAGLTGRRRLKYVARLISYFDRVGELGDPTEANALFGPPSTTLEEWCLMSRDMRENG